MAEVLKFTFSFSLEAQGRLTLNLNKIQDMQVRLRHNLDAIGMLNQQVRAHTHTHIPMSSHLCLRRLTPDPLTLTQF